MIYVELMEDVKLKPGQEVWLKDIARVWRDDGVEKPDFPLFALEKSLVKVDVLEVIRSLKRRLPEEEIQSVGSAFCWIQYEKKRKKAGFWGWSLAVMIAFLMFIGGGMAILNFHEDVNMVDVHKRLVFMVTGEEVENPLWVSIPYSLGLAGGIAIFFNLIPAMKKKKDPSPLELEYQTFQEQMDDYKKTKAENDDGS